MADQASAIEKLAQPPSFPNKLETVEECGLEETVAQGVAQTSDTACHQLALADESADSRTQEECSQGIKKPSREQGFGVVRQSSSSDDTSSGGGIRTPDTRIMIPLL